MGSSFRALLIVLFITLATLVDKTQQQCATSTNYQIIPQTNIKDNAPNVIRLGVIGTMYSAWPTAPGSIMRFAAQRINSRTDILPDTRIELAFIPNTANDLSSNLLLALFAIQNLTVQGIIGGLSTTESRVIQLAAKLYNVPQISAHAAAEVLANKDEYPLYACTTPYDKAQVDTIVALFKHLTWRRAVVLFNDNDYGAGFNNLRVKGAESDIDFVGLPISASAQTEDQIRDQMEQVRHQMADKKYRVCILYLTANSTVLVMKLAQKMGLVGNQYAYVVSTNAAGALTQAGGTEIRELLRGAIVISLPFPAGPFYEEEAKIYDDLQTSVPSLRYWKQSSAWQYFWVTYDPVMTYAYAFDALLKKGVPFNQIKGQTLYNQILNTTYIGVSGNMTFNAGGDRKGFYTIASFDGNSTQKEVARYSQFTDSVTPISNFIFYDGSSNIPDDGTGRDFSKGLAGGLGAIIGIAVLVAFFAIAMLVLNWGVFIKKYGVFYCGVILSGVLTSYVAAFSLLPEPSDALCVVFPWFLGIAFTLVYGCLFIKAWILYRLWRYALQLKRLSITALTVVKYVGVALAVEIILLIVWTVVDPPKVHMVKLVDGTYMAQCHSDTPVFWIIFLSMKGVWLLFGVVVSVLTRSVVKEYNNFTEFAYAMYNILIMTIIAVPLGVLLEKVPNGVLIVSVIVIVLAFMFTTIILFFNIWYSLLYNDQMPAVSSMQAKSSRSPSQSKITDNSHSNGSNDASSRA